MRRSRSSSWTAARAFWRSSTIMVVRCAALWLLKNTENSATSTTPMIATATISSVSPKPRCAARVKSKRFILASGARNDDDQRGLAGGRQRRPVGVDGDPLAVRHRLVQLNVPFDVGATGIRIVGVGVAANVQIPVIVGRGEQALRRRGRGRGGIGLAAGRGHLARAERHQHAERERTDGEHQERHHHFDQREAPGRLRARRGASDEFAIGDVAHGWNTIPAAETYSVSLCDLPLTTTQPPVVLGHSTPLMSKISESGGSSETFVNLVPLGRSLR